MPVELTPTIVSKYVVWHAQATNNAMGVVSDAKDTVIDVVAEKKVKVVVRALGYREARKVKKGAKAKLGAQAYEERLTAKIDKHNDKALAKITKLSKNGK